MRSTNNNKSSGPQSRIKSPVKRPHLCKNQRTSDDSGEHSPGKSLQDVPLDDAIPFPRLSFTTSAILVAVLSLITYWNSRHGDFVFDDLEAILKNQDVRSETPLWSLFQHDFWGKSIELKESHKSYRPLTILTFRFNYYLAGGLYPWGFHFANILLHAIVSVLVLPVSSALLKVKEDAGKRGDVGYLASPKASLLCAILFAVHPIHTENVAGIVGRADLLCALFFFMAFLIYTSACKSDSSCLHPSPSQSFLHLTLSMISCAMAMLCKEQGITVIGLCGIYDIIIHCGIDPISACYTTYTTLNRHHEFPDKQLDFRSQDLKWLKRLLLRQLVLIMSAILLLFTRFFIMGSGAPTFQEVDNPASFLENIWLRIINYSYIYSLNTWLLLYPWWLCFDWSMGCIPLIQTPLDVRMVAPIAFWIIMGFIVYHCLCGSDHYERRLLTVSVSALIIPFLPASNVFFRVGFVIAERVLYLPSLGFCLLVVMGTRRLCLNGSSIMKKVMPVLLLVIVVCHTTRCYHRNSEWLTENKLYRSGLKVCPGNAKVHYNIGKSESDAGHTQEAIGAYREAIRLNPEYDQALNNLGNILRDLNQTEEAEMLISEAVKIRPTFAAAWMNLGIVQATLQKHKEAEASYLTALKHRNNYPDCYFNLGNLHLALGNTDQAVSAWLNATSLLNTHAEAWSNTLLLLDNLGQYSTAVSVGQEALKYVKEDPSIYYAMGNVLGKLERFKEAEEMYQQAIHYRPDAASYHGNLGVLYHRWGKLEEAYHQYQRSMTLDPSSQVTAENLRKLGRKLRKKETV